MHYKGYVGKVTYYPSDRLFFGTVIGIKDVISFQGASVDELNQAFRDSVDNYLEWNCELGNKEPQRSYSGKLKLKMGSDLHAQLASEAMENEMSLKDLILCKLKK